MPIDDEGFAVLQPGEQRWRVSNMMKIPNTNLLHDLGGSAHLGGRLWRLPPYSANTWHKHVDSWELYFLLEGAGRMRVGNKTIGVTRYGCVLVAPRMLRQVFNDTPQESLWLIVGAPQEGQSGVKADPSSFYPEDPTSLPPELASRVWPPS
jgi:mannose-6-phosphate isomerase-like protein (cupin superfamily)